MQPWCAEETSFKNSSNYSKRLTGNVSSSLFSFLIIPEYRMHSPAGVSQRAWTPHYTPQHNPTHHLQQQQPTAQTHPHPPPDYQHNVYIPGTPSGFCTLRPSYRSELDVHNSFSTFGKKRRFISPSSYDPHDDTGPDVINNDLYNEWNKTKGPNQWWWTKRVTCCCYQSIALIM